MTMDVEGGNRWQRLQPRERALVIIFGIIAVLAIIYLVFVSGGEDEPQSQSSPRPTVGVTPRPTITTSPSPTSPPRTFEVFEGKDPFRPLVGGGIAGGGGGGGTPGPSGGPGGDTNGAQRVTLLEITGSGASRTATVRVDSTEYTVKEGETFAGSYRVKTLTTRCGTFVFGDEQFTLCVGQEVLK
jgi:hypothetical protein